MTGGSYQVEVDDALKVLNTPPHLGVTGFEGGCSVDLVILLAIIRLVSQKAIMMMPSSTFSRV